MLKLPKATDSLWREAYPSSSIYPELSEDLSVDVIIIGAGITGLTSAYLLKQAGLTVAVIDKDTVGGGTTGRTTGKVTSQHNIVYTDLEKHRGIEVTRAYAAANQAAVEEVARIVKLEKIDCDFERDDNYVFTTDVGKIEQFKAEAAIAKELGLPASFTTETTLPFDVKGAVKFSNQAKMSAQKYAMGLAKAVHGNGSFVFEHSTALRIHDGSPAIVSTKKATITAKDIIVATNVPAFPLIARGGYCVYEYPTLSYIVAGPLTKHVDGMYISPDDNQFSVLPVTVSGQPMLLVGGKGHFTGRPAISRARYQKLADYGEEHFGLAKITHRWSDRDYLSYDNVPLVGAMYPWSKHLYVGTAFKKWGLSNGTAAAMMLTDVITSKKNPWVKAFTPNRFDAIKGIPRSVAKETIAALTLK